MIVEALEPARLVAESASKVRLARAHPWRSRLARKSGHYQDLEENESRIRTAGLIEFVSRTSRSLVDTHQPDIRTAPQGVFGARNGEVGPWVRPGSSRIDIHHPKFKLSKRASHLGPSIDRNLLPRYRIDPDLATEEEQVRFSFEGEAKNPCILQEELSLFRKEQLVRSEIELLRIDVRIGKIRIDREVGNKI